MILCISLVIAVLILSALLIIALGWNGIVNAASSNYTTLSNGTTSSGMTGSELVAKWWTWVLGIPNDVHPEKKYPDAQRCSVMQNGSVWFLPDVSPGVGTVNYSCNIPSGKDIMVPLTTSECDAGTEGSLTDKELVDCADNIVTPISNIEVTVDGKKVDINGSPVKTNFFNVTYPENPLDIFGAVKPGTYKGIATGYFLYLNGMTAGEHKINLKVVDLLKGNEGPPPKFDPPREGSFDINIK
jgi:hypothetical protein